MLKYIIIGLLLTGCTNTVQDKILRQHKMVKLSNGTARLCYQIIDQSIDLDGMYCLEYAGDNDKGPIRK